MKNIKLHIAYDGSRYHGWQRLRNNEQTIQGKIEKVVSEMVGTSIEIIGSGRTDAGVHAKEQVANFHTLTKMSEEDIYLYINRYLPKDIVVNEVALVPERFHSRYNAKSKKYVYYIWNHRAHSPFNRKYSYSISDSLDIENMNHAINKLQGTHDFLGFSSLKKTNKSTIRSIHSISIKKEESLLSFTFTGDGFLHNMVRIMMGSIIDVGLHKKSPSHIDEIFEHKLRSHAGITVPPQGLFLEKVYY